MTLTYYNESSEDESGSEYDELREDETMNYYNESSEDEDEEDIMYEPDEPSPTKYNIVLCEIYNNKIHGVNRDALINQYMVVATFKHFDVAYLNRMSRFYNGSYVNNINKITPHSCIRNYTHIITRPNYVKPEIAHSIRLEGGEQVCIIKTFWIRLIQRAWKRVFRERQYGVRRRGNPRSLMNRQLTGTWATRMPSIKGMLLFSNTAS